jgi:hypothetical protein
LGESGGSRQGQGATQGKECSHLYSSNNSAFLSRRGSGEIAIVPLTGRT